MTTLTFEAIRRNPWNVVTHELPDRPNFFLLQAAHLAANYCRTSEFGFMIAAREGWYRPYGWRPSANCPDLQEACEQRGVDADWRLEQICDLYKRLFGVDLGR